MTIAAECADGSEVDLSGNYQFGFTAECQDVDGSPSAACSVFMDTLDDDKKVVLDVAPSPFVDICDMALFEKEFTAEMAFYTDEALTVEADGSDPFVIGQDTIYGKVTVNIEEELSYLFEDVSIEKVYVCTAPDTAEMTVSSADGTGGCLSSNIDADGPYTVIGEGSDPQYEGLTDLDVAENNEAAFSFLTFGTLSPLSLSCTCPLSTCACDGCFDRMYVDQTPRERLSMCTSKCC